PRFHPYPFPYSFLLSSYLSRPPRALHSFPTRRSSDLIVIPDRYVLAAAADHCLAAAYRGECPGVDPDALMRWRVESRAAFQGRRSEEHTSELQSRENLVCRLLLEKKKKKQTCSKYQHS